MIKILTLLAFFGLFCVITGQSDEAKNPSLKIEIISANSSRVAEDHETIYAESEIMLICSIVNDIKIAEVRWDRDGKDFTNSTIIEMKTPSQNDTGNYTCLVEALDGNLTSKSINLTIVTEFANISAEEYHVRSQLNTSTTLSCDLTGYPLSDLTWVKILPNGTELLIKNSNISYLDNVPTKMSHHIENVSDLDNGTYECRAIHRNTTKSSKSHLIVIGVPELITTFVKSVGKGKIYLSWRINEHNEPLENYSIDQRQKGVEEWETRVTVMGRGNSSLLLTGLETDVTYKFRITASNSLGTISEEFDSGWVPVLKEDPDFVVPDVTILEKSGNWITIGWTIPPENLREYFHYYDINMGHGHKEPEIRYCPAEIVGIYKFTNIENPDDYRFRVRACNNYTKQCCAWSPSSISIKPSSEISVIAASIFSLYFLSR